MTSAGVSVPFTLAGEVVGQAGVVSRGLGFVTESQSQTEMPPFV
jgi:hypothetical protein